MNGMESKNDWVPGEGRFSPVTPTGGHSVMGELLFHLNVCLEMSPSFSSLTLFKKRSKKGPIYEPSGYTEQLLTWLSFLVNYS